MRHTVNVQAVQTVGDFNWCLKSTTEERGKALIGIALEWSGDSTHDLVEREATDCAAEQLINMLAFVATNYGDSAALKIIAEAMARSEDWIQE